MYLFKFSLYGINYLNINDLCETLLIYEGDSRMYGTRFRSITKSIYILKELTLDLVMAF